MLRRVSNVHRTPTPQVTAPVMLSAVACAGCVLSHERLAFSHQHTDGPSHLRGSDARYRLLSPLLALRVLVSALHSKNEIPNPTKLEFVFLGAKNVFPKGSLVRVASHISVQKPRVGCRHFFRLALNIPTFSLFAWPSFFRRVPSCGIITAHTFQHAIVKGQFLFELKIYFSL